MEAFAELFDRWATSYDQTVYGKNHEYVEVFESYDNIMERMCQLASQRLPRIALDIGMGTGNLCQKLASQGWFVVGVDPSPEMRKMATRKLSGVVIVNGHFLSVPIESKVDAIFSSYALHHLPYLNKVKAIRYLDAFLNPGGKFVIADTMFESKEYQLSLIKDAEESRFYDLLNDLNTEYYEGVQAMVKIFQDLGYEWYAEKQNKYVWIISAEKVL